MTGKPISKSILMISSILSILILLSAAGGDPAQAGQNADAGCAIDLDYATTAIDSSKVVEDGDVFWVAIMAQGVSNLDTYQVKVNFDENRLEFLQGIEELVNPFDPSGDIPNILKTNGGETIGFQAVLEPGASGVVNLSNSLTGSDPGEAPEGDGLLGLLQFRVIDAANTSLTLSGVSYLDTSQIVDFPSSLSNAQLTVQGAPPVPTISFFTAAPSTIQEGSSSLLSWSITGADSATIDNGLGTVNATSGSISISPSANTTYTLTATNAAGDTTATASVQVSQLVQPPVIDSFAVTPSTIQDGQSAALSWSISGATSASIDNGVGPVNPSSGSLPVSPSESTTYTLTATNADGSDTAAAVLTVTTGGGSNADAGCAVDLDAATQAIDSTGTFALNDEFWIAIKARDVVNLDTYQVEVDFDETRLSFLQGVEENPAAGITNLLKTNGGQTIGFQAVSNSPGVVNLSNALVGSDPAQAPEGDGILGLLQFKVISPANSSMALSNVRYQDSFSAIDSPGQLSGAQVLVESAQPPAIVFFAASPATIDQGQTTVLSWSISGGDSASIDNGIGAVNASSGSVSVSPTTNTVYTLSAVNAEGVAAATATVQVNAVVSKPTIVSFAVNPVSIQQGASAVLSWVVTGADTANIDNGIGVVAATAGSLSISPSVDTVYTLTAANAGGSVTATATLEVTASGEGPNADAGCALDLDYTTAAVESTKTIAANEEFWVAVVAQDAVNLDTYQVEVNFDETLLTFVQGVEENPFEGVANFLKKNGGQTVGFQAVTSSPGVVNLSNALVGNDPAQAPEGDGILGLLKFQVNNSADTYLTLSNVSYLDSSAIKDSPGQILGAQLLAQSVQSPMIDYFAVAPSSIQEGGSATLSWSISDASSASIDNSVGGVNAVGGNISVSPATDTTYTLSASNAGGTTTASVDLTVVPVVAKPEIASFTVAPESIEEGQSATLSWTVEGADSVFIDNGVGSVDSASGNVAVSPTIGAVYTLTATNQGGSVTASVSLEVTIPHVDGPNATAGCAVDMDYSTTEIESHKIVQKDEEFWAAVVARDVVNLDTYQVEIVFDSSRLSFLQGAADNPAGGIVNILKTQGGQTLGFQAALASTGVVNVANSLVGKDENQAPEGDGVLALLKFKVLDASSNTSLNPENISYVDSSGKADSPSHLFGATVGPQVVVTPVIESFSANPSSITEGSTAALSWSISNADSAVIDNGVGAVDPAGGTFQVSPVADTVYTLVASHQSGGQATATVSVDVSPAFSAPVVEYFTASPQTVERGQQALLSWSATGADTVYIDNGVGYVNVEAGYFQVFPTQTTTYSMLAVNQTGSTAANVTVSVVDPSVEGPNANASCLIDLDYATPQVESSKMIRAGEQFWFAIVARDVVNLDTYQVEINFDPAKLAFDMGVEENPFESISNILKANEGSTIGFQAVEIAPGKVNVANALVGNSQESAPEGEGVLALLKFTVLDASEATSIVLSDISYIDSTGNNDSPANVSDGLLYVESVTNPVIDSFAANPSSIVGGQSAALSWSITNAVAASIDNGIGAVNPLNGSIFVSPDQDVAYTLTATNANGTVSTSVQLEVTDPPEGPNADAGCAVDFDYETAELESSKTFQTGDRLWVAVVAKEVENLDTYQVEIGFDDSQLSFDGGYEENAMEGVHNILKSAGGATVGFQAEEYAPGAINVANALSGDDPGLAPDGDGVLALLRFTVINAVSDTQLTLSNIHYIDTAGADDSPALVENGVLRLPVASAPAISAFSATPDSIAVGDSATLSWSIEGAESASIDNGVGVVNHLGGTVEVSPGEDVVYTLTAANLFGTVTASVSLTVSPLIVKPTIHYFTADPFAIYHGDFSTLSWGITGADMVTIDNAIGVVANDNGEIDVYPDKDTTYMLKASNPAGDAVAYVTVHVDPAVELPVVESFEALPAVIKQGDSVLLTWKVAGADNVSIFNGIGPVHPVSGEYRVKPEFTATYTLIAENEAGEVSAETTVVLVSALTTAVVEIGPGTGTVVGISKGSFRQDPTSAVPPEDWSPYFPFGFYGIEIENLSPGAELAIDFEAPANIVDGEAQFFTYINNYLDIFEKAYGLGVGDEKFVIVVADGGPGDADGAVDGNISFLGGPAVDSGFGPNVDAACAIDMHHQTRDYSDSSISVRDIESSACGAVGEDVWLFVVAVNVNNLDTYQAQVDFDPARLLFVEGTEDNAYEGVPNILKKNGGSTLGFEAKETAPGTVNIANSLTGNDAAEAPEGSGVLALLNFRALDDDYENAVSLSNVYFIDTFGSMRQPPLADEITRLYGASVNPRQIFVAETPQDCLDATECYMSCFNFFREGVDAVPDANTPVVVLPGTYYEPLVIDRQTVTVVIRHLSGPVVLE